LPKYTGSQTDGQTDDSVMTIADHTVWQYDRLITVHDTAVHEYKRLYWT